MSRSEPHERFPDAGRGDGQDVDPAELAALQQFAATVTRDFSLGDILRQLAQAVTRVLDVDGAGVASPDEGTGRLRLVYASEGSVRELEQEEADDLGVRAVATIPLVSGGRTWGALDIYRRRALALSEEELATATMLAHVATSYLVVADDRATALRVQQEVAQRAMYDALTSLPVRWVFLEHLTHALDRLRRTPHLVVVLLLHFDGLTDVNDIAGRAAADRLLLGSVDRIRSALRPADTLARLGRDEFVVLLEDVVRLKDATEIAERVLARLAEPSVPDSRVIRTSASIGLAATADPETSGATLIAHADSAMCEARRSGGGGYQVFDPTA